VQLINKVFVYAMARHFVLAALLIPFILALNVNPSIHPALSRHIFNGKSSKFDRVVWLHCDVLKPLSYDY
jgi:hypothetical protein